MQKQLDLLVKHRACGIVIKHGLHGPESEQGELWAQREYTTWIWQLRGKQLALV